MSYVSTRDNSKEYSFEDVFIKGLADDGGLYVPTSLKKFSLDKLSKLKNLNYYDLSTEIINLFSSDFISKEDFSFGAIFSFFISDIIYRRSVMVIYYH